MKYILFLVLGYFHALLCQAQTGALQIIDHDGQCLIWSEDNYGCTGYSAAFGLLNGEDCSQITKVVNGTRHGYSSLQVDVCGTENGLAVAWIQVYQTGHVNFFNKNGDRATCVLGNGLKAGSWCAVSANEVYTISSRAISSSQSTSTPSTSTPSISTPSTSTPSTSTPSTSTPSTSTPSITTTENDLHTVLCHVIVYPSSTVTTSCSSVS